MKKGLAVYPGTFDPITNGHLDIINRALSIFDKLIIGVSKNSSKNAKFSVEERLNLVNLSIQELGNSNHIEVHSFNSLVVDFVNESNSDILIRGLRAISDFEYEFQMALMNRTLSESIETVFLMASDKYQFISSSFVREIYYLGGDISQFVPKSVSNILKKKC